MSHHNTITLLISFLQIDLAEAAKLFGITYSALEWQFRPLKREAKELQKNGNKGTSLAGTPSRTKSTTSTPKSKTAKKGALHGLYSSVLTCSSIYADKEQPLPTDVFPRLQQRRVA